MANSARSTSPAKPRVAVVGHIEWVDFVSLPRYPGEGELLAADQWSARVGGGGGVAAGVLADMGAEVDFFLALGRDSNGQAAVDQLSERGVRTHVAWRDTMTRRAITYLTSGGERTIITIGERLETVSDDDLDWDRLRSADGVYFTAGDPGTLLHAREARILTASPRGRDGLRTDPPERSGPGSEPAHRDALKSEPPRLDALIFSEEDADEREWAHGIEDRADLMVATEGDRGGHWWGASEGRWETVAPEGPIKDAYGAGDSFAAAFTFGLAAGRSVAEAAQLGAKRGALALTRVGAP
jgi:ribokinase